MTDPLVKRLEKLDLVSLAHVNKPPEFNGPALLQVPRPTPNAETYRNSVVVSKTC